MGRPDANNYPLNNCHCCLFQEGTLTKDMMNLEMARFTAPVSTVETKGLVLRQNVRHDSFLYK